MLRASPYLRQVLYRELAGRLRALGYEPYEMSSKGFSVRGVEHLRERFSKRTRHVQKLTGEFSAKKGHKATKREIEILVRESRADKLAEAITREVRARQRAELSPDGVRASNRNQDGLQARRLTRLLRALHWIARRRVVMPPPIRFALGRATIAHAKARHSRRARDYPARLLRHALESHPDIIRKNGEMTLRSIYREEAVVVR